MSKALILEERIQKSINNTSEIKISNDVKKEILKSYINDNIPVKILSNQYKVDKLHVDQLVKATGLLDYKERRYKTYKLDERYFDDIDTGNKAYTLGFLFADGNNSPKKATVSMALQEDDKDILEKIRLDMKSERVLEFIDYSHKHDFGYKYKNQYRLLLFSTHVCQSLKFLGMVPNKSLVLEFPDIDPKFYPHFIRGYFDGDGSFCPHYSKTGNFQPLITFTSTNNFCIKLQEILINELGIAGGNIYDASCHNGITKVLSISGAIQTKKILDWIYTDTDMCLERKYIKYRDAFDNYMAA